MNPYMNLQLKISAIVLTAILFAVIIELVRRRKLREEFAWIWLLAGSGIFILAIWEDLILFIGKVTGIIAPTSILFSFGIIFLMLINLDLSIKISKNNDRIKNLVQRLAIYEKNLQDSLKGKK